MLAAAPAGKGLNNFLTSYFTDMKNFISLLTTILLCTFFGGVFAGATEYSPIVHVGISAVIFGGSFLLPFNVLSLVCAPNCISAIPRVIGAGSCDFVDRKGGIPRLTFLNCSYSSPEFPLSGGWENPVNVRAAICSEVLFVTGEILGQKPAPSFNKKRFTSCSPEKTVSGTQTLTFSDFNHDPDDLVEFEFWQAIVDNKRNLLVGWITCDDLWYQYDGDWDIELGEQTEDTKEGNSFFAGTITISEKNIIAPIKVPGINAMLNSFDGTCEYYLS